MTGAIAIVAAGDLVLDRKDVGEVAVVALGPDVLAVLGLD